METYTNDKGEVVVIAEMEGTRLIHALAKYSRFFGASEARGCDDDYTEELVKSLKLEILKRLGNQHDADAMAGIVNYCDDAEFRNNFKEDKLYEFLSEKFNVTYKK